eukprot:scpid35640/ scgid23106/ Uncharacterized protein C4orf37 homolog
MYGRSVRVLHQENRSTVDHVGPGTYDMPEKKKNEGAAPFSSFTKRTTFLDVPDQTVVAPGPGRYNADLKVGAPGSLAGTSSLASRTQRFETAATTAPGPGAYNVPESKSKPSLNRTFPPAPGAVTVDDKSDAQRRRAHPEKPRIKYVARPTAPSIPAGKQAQGFVESANGQLQPHRFPEEAHDPTIGPAYYQIPDEEAEPTKRYKGAHFSKRTAPRFPNQKPSNAPPPGHYNVEPRKPRPQTAPPPKEEERAMNVRYHELLEKQEAKRDIPGPGQYNVGTELGKPAPGGSNHAEPAITVPFGALSTRFVGQKPQCPPVGTYDDNRTSLQTVKRVTGMNKNPFGQSTARFKHERPSRLPPAPSKYNTDHGTSIVDNCIRNAHVGRNGAFGTLSKRETKLGDSKKAPLPGPAHYHPTQRGTDGGAGITGDGVHVTAVRVRKPTSQFISHTKRLDELNRKGKEAPPPGSYEVAQSFAAMHAQQSKAKPVTMAAQARQTSFLAGQSRFSEAGMEKRTGDPKNPAPGRYGTEQYQAVGKNTKLSLMVTKTDRFNNQVSNTPGPGAYQLPSSVQHTVLKGTHNATLNNPLISADDASSGTGRAGRKAGAKAAKFSVGPV